MKINQLKYSEEQIKEFGKYYKAEHSLKETAEKFGVNYHTHKQNLIRFRYSIPKKKLENQRVEEILYFDKIDTPEKAYLLGFLFSDGYIAKTAYGVAIGLALQLHDKYILEYIKQAWGVDNKISEYKNSAKIQVTDSHMYNRLVELGIQEDKSHQDYILPNIDENLLNSFVLGYFDGDGCITIKSTGYSVTSICCNSKIFLESVKQFLNKNGIETRDVTIEKRPKNNIYVLYISKRAEQIKFMDFIYKDNSIFLKRKHDKFLQIPR